MAGYFSQKLYNGVSGTIDGVYDLYRKLIITGETEGKFGRKPITSLLTSENIEREYNENVASVTVDGNLKSSDPLETWSQERLSSLDAFTALKGSDDKPSPFASALIKKMKTPSANLTHVKDEIKKALILDPKTTDDKTAFAKNIAAINAILSEGSSVQLQALAGYLQELKADAKNTMLAQHQAENSKVAALFDNTDFQTKAKASMGLDDPGLEQFKSDTLDALKQSQDKALQTMETTINNEVNKLHQYNAGEALRIAYLATMWKESTEMRRKMRAMAAQNEQDKGPLVVDYDAETGVAKFKNLNIRDIGTIETITGTEIKITAGATKDQDSFSMVMPKYGFLYYRSNKIDMDLLSLATAVRACGHEGIQMSVTHKDEELALRIARKQFEACVAAGFDPEMKDDPKNAGKKICAINIVMNGKKIENPEKELFGDRKTQYLTIMEKYKDRVATDKALIQSATPQTIQDMKSKVQAKRQAMDTPPPAPSSSPAP